ncbi:MAG: MFS transporter [Ignavibacteria bacterium CG2_30_36_16]|nr:MAG: MFS transporter [Ignavibacteria bacterium CG2_30_36_16]
MSNNSTLQLVKTGFKPSFWVANIMELFERIAYYGQNAILAVFLRNHLKFDEVETGALTSIFGGLIYLLPIFAGALADKYGFKKAFSFAFFILAIGYFLIGSTGMEAFSGWYENFDLFWALTIILIFTAIGGSFIKPSVLGTVALTSTPESKSLGYAIYYWLVNIGGALGPLFAFLVRDSIGIEMVYLTSALSCTLMFVTTLVLFKEPADVEVKEYKSLLEVFKNLLLVLTRFRFIIFLLIFSLYWLMFWQIFIIVPFYITDYISPDAPFELITSVGAWSIILLQLPINLLTKKLSPTGAIATGFLISTLCWAIILINPSIPLFIAGIVVFSIGEQMQAPRYYEYIADLAPKGQTALFQGYAFLPIAIGWGFGGTLGGWIYKTFATDSNQPGVIFVILICVGLAATIFMWMYNLYVKRNG